jgi:hypothetical protein
MKMTLATVSLLLLPAVLAGAARPASGSLCIAKFRDSESSRSAPGFDCLAGSRALQIDTRARMPWPQHTSEEISDVPLEGVRRIRLFCDGRPLQSFTFRFSQFPSTRLCLYLDDMYQTPQLKTRSRQTPWCDCK